MVYRNTSRAASSSRVKPPRFKEAENYTPDEFKGGVVRQPMIINTYRS